MEHDWGTDTMDGRPASPERSAKIFINYRREDSAGHAGRLLDRLRERFPGRVFMDIDTIQPGVDFVDVIEQAVGSCEVLIVMIGREWLTATDASGHRRLDNSADFVRLEVATALARGIRVIPVLVEGAAMPRADELPPDLAKLARRNAIELSDARWAYDVDRLLRTIEEVLGEQGSPGGPAAAPPSATPARGQGAKVWIAALAVLVLAAGGWVLWNLRKSPPQKNDVAPPGNVATDTPSAASPFETPEPEPGPALAEETPEQTPEDTPEAAPRIHSQGRLTVRGTWKCDLDLGAETQEGADFWWEQATRTERYLAPQNGAVFSVLGARDFDAVTPADLPRLRYSVDRIRSVDALSSQLPAGAVVAYRTNEGRPGKLLVESPGYNLTLRWVTYASPGNPLRNPRIRLPESVRRRGSGR